MEHAVLVLQHQLEQKIRHLFPSISTHPALKQTGGVEDTGENITTQGQDTRTRPRQILESGLEKGKRQK